MGQSRDWNRSTFIYLITSNENLTCIASTSFFRPGQHNYILSENPVKIDLVVNIQYTELVKLTAHGTFFDRLLAMSQPLEGNMEGSYDRHMICAMYEQGTPHILYKKLKTLKHVLHINWHRLFVFRLSLC